MPPCNTEGTDGTTAGWVTDIMVALFSFSMVAYMVRRGVDSKYIKGTFLMLGLGFTFGSLQHGAYPNRGEDGCGMAGYYWMSSLGYLTCGLTMVFTLLAFHARLRTESKNETEDSQVTRTGLKFNCLGCFTAAVWLLVLVASFVTTVAPLACLGEVKIVKTVHDNCTFDQIITNAPNCEQALLIGEIIFYPAWMGSLFVWGFIRTGKLWARISVALTTFFVGPGLVLNTGILSAITGYSAYYYSEKYSLSIVFHFGVIASYIPLYFLMKEAGASPNYDMSCNDDRRQADRSENDVQPFDSHNNDTQNTVTSEEETCILRQVRNNYYRQDTTQDTETFEEGNDNRRVSKNDYLYVGDTLFLTKGSDSDTSSDDMDVELQHTDVELQPQHFLKLLNKKKEKKKSSGDVGVSSSASDNKTSPSTPIEFEFKRNNVTFKKRQIEETDLQKNYYLIPEENLLNKSIIGEKFYVYKNELRKLIGKCEVEGDDDTPLKFNDNGIICMQGDRDPIYFLCERTTVESSKTNKKRRKNPEKQDYSETAVDKTPKKKRKRRQEPDKKQKEEVDIGWLMGDHMFFIRVKAREKGKMKVSQNLIWKVEPRKQKGEKVDIINWDSNAHVTIFFCKECKKMWLFKANGQNKILYSNLMLEELIENHFTSCEMDVVKTAILMDLTKAFADGHSELGPMLAAESIQHRKKIMSRPGVKKYQREFMERSMDRFKTISSDTTASILSKYKLPTSLPAAGKGKSKAMTDKEVLSFFSEGINLKSDQSKEKKIEDPLGGRSGGGRRGKVKRRSKNDPQHNDEGKKTFLKKQITQVPASYKTEGLHDEHKLLTQQSFEEIDNMGQGDCMFYALINSGVDAFTSLEVQDIRNRLKDNTGTTPGIERMGIWGQDRDLQIVSKEFDVVIFLASQADEHWRIFTPNNDTSISMLDEYWNGKILYLWHKGVSHSDEGDGNHYTTLIPQGDNVRRDNVRQESTETIRLDDSGLLT
eukprot:g3066.t1